MLLVVFANCSHTVRHFCYSSHQAALRAKRSGIHMIVLGVGGWTDESELRAIASFPQTRNYIRVRNYADLRNFADRLTDYICNGEPS